jgi:chromosomal replication initiator protein
MLTPFLKAPENISAWMAFQDLLTGLTTTTPTLDVPLLFLHGPSGSGKTHLVRDLADQATQHQIHVCLVSSNDFAEQDPNRIDRQADLLIIEDLQHLPTRYAETLVQIIDERLKAFPTVCTALCGPAQLNHRGISFPQRLTTRLAGGLVVAVEPLQMASRRQLLELIANEHEAHIASDVLDWFAEHLTGGGRQLEGTIRQLKTLTRLSNKPLRLDDCREHFGAQVEANMPTVQKITEHVSGYFHVEPKRLLTGKRSRDVLLPRQVSMYLARRLTKLSLEQIGRYFGGRDHKTVQHACKKVELAMKSDRSLSGMVRQMHAELA